MSLSETERYELAFAMALLGYGEDALRSVIEPQQAEAKP